MPRQWFVDRKKEARRRRYAIRGRVREDSGTPLGPERQHKRYCSTFLWVYLFEHNEPRGLCTRFELRSREKGSLKPLHRLKVNQTREIIEADRALAGKIKAFT